MTMSFDDDTPRVTYDHPGPADGTRHTGINYLVQDRAGVDWLNQMMTKLCEHLDYDHVLVEGNEVTVTYHLSEGLPLFCPYCLMYSPQDS